MKKNLKKLGLVLSIVACMGMATGCGKKSNKKVVEDMVDKYSSCCTLGEYKGIEYEESKTVITDEDVQYYVNSLLDSYSTSTEVTSGTVESGDTVNIDFVGTVDGVEFEGGSTNGNGYELTLGSGMMIDGFEEQIMGHDVGESFDIYVTFPEQYTEELAGKDAVFAIKINSKIEKVHPDYNDAFVAANTEYDTVAAYEEYILTALTENAANDDETKNKTAVITEVINASTVNEYPQEDMQKLIDDTVDQVEGQAVSSGYTLQDYVMGYFGMASVEDFEAYVGEIVKSYMTEKIVVCAVAKAENITVSNDEIAEYKAGMMEETGITDEETFDENYTSEDVAYYTLAEKVVDFLLENAKPIEATSTDAAQ